MGYGIGSLLSVIVAVFAKFVGFDRDRAFYPTVLIVVGAVVWVIFPVLWVGFFGYGCCNP